MLFYECSMSYKIKKDSRLEKMTEQPKKMWGDFIFQDLNDMLAENSTEKIEIVVCGAKIGKFNLIAASDSLEKITAEMLSKIFVKRLSEYEITSVKILSLSEITPAIAAKLLRQADRNDYMTYRCNWERNGFGDNEDFTLDYYDNRNFKIEEKIIPEKILSYENAKKSAENMMVEKSFLDELERIYSAENPKEFFGHPVHYKKVYS